MSAPAVAVREHGMLMSGPMVRATLRDVNPKTKTRRVATDHNSTGSFKVGELDLAQAWVDPGLGGGQYLKAPLLPEVAERLGEKPGDTSHRLFCRYHIGDRLWVRETFGLVRMHEFGQHVYGGPRIPDRDKVVYAAGKLMGIPVPNTSPIEFRSEWRDDFKPARWRPSIHMPRWASRLTLEITDVRVERVEDITNEDAIAEGCTGGPNVEGYSEMCPADPYEEFAILWDSLNAKRGYDWNSNPWVWVLAFRRVDP